MSTEPKFIDALLQAEFAAESPCEYTAAYLRDACRLMERKLREIAASGPDDEPDAEDYDDTESAFNKGEDCGAWSAKCQAEVALDDLARLVRAAVYTDEGRMIAIRGEPS